MPGPARAGLSIYAKDQQRMASFYQLVVGMSRIHDSSEVIVLQSTDIQFVIHRIPQNRVAGITISAPPQLRDSALKFFFTVPSISAARSTAGELGGDVGFEQRQGPGLVVCNGNDPEEDVFHVRESVA
ncbi:MAG: glyoxalase/bleomycin resistance/dioxygenase family protein [Pseudomonadota bacterium]